MYFQDSQLVPCVLLSEASRNTSDILPQPGRNLSPYSLAVPESLQQRNLLQLSESVHLTSVGLNNQNSVG